MQAPLRVGAASWRLIMLVIAALGASAMEARAEIAVAQGWIAPSPPGAPATGSVVIVNAGAEADRLLGARSPAARATFLAEERFVDGAYRAQPIEALSIAPGATLRLGSRDASIRLEGVERRLHLNAEVPITLVFEEAGPIEVVFQVRDGVSAGVSMASGSSEEPAPAPSDAGGEGRSVRPPRDGGEGH